MADDLAASLAASASASDVTLACAAAVSSGAFASIASASALASASASALASALAIACASSLALAARAASTLTFSFSSWVSRCRCSRPSSAAAHSPFNEAENSSPWSLARRAWLRRAPTAISAVPPFAGWAAAAGSAAASFSLLEPAPAACGFSASTLLCRSANEARGAASTASCSTFSRLSPAASAVSAVSEASKATVAAAAFFIPALALASASALDLASALAFACPSDVTLAWASPSALTARAAASTPTRAAFSSWVSRCRCSRPSSAAAHSPFNEAENSSPWSLARRAWLRRAPTAISAVPPFAGWAAAAGSAAASFSLLEPAPAALASPGTGVSFCSVFFASSSPSPRYGLTLSSFATMPELTTACVAQPGTAACSGEPKLSGETGCTGLASRVAHDGASVGRA